MQVKTIFHVFENAGFFIYDHSRQQVILLVIIFMCFYRYIIENTLFTTVINRVFSKESIP